MKTLLLTIICLSLFITGCGKKEAVEDESFEDQASGFIDEPIQFENRASTDIVLIMVDDEFYHKSDCHLVSGDTERMTVSRAEKKGYYACEYCIGFE